jgi:hypothetical protein
MKYAVLVLCFALSFQGVSQERFSFNIGIGYGAYKMEELKKFHDAQEYFWGRGRLKNTADFPAAVFYSVEMAYRINKFAVGIIYRNQSTNYRTRYADGIITFDSQQEVESDNAGIMLSYQVWEHKKFSMSVQVRTYHGWTDVKWTQFQENLDVPEVNFNRKVNDDGRSFMLDPDLTHSYDASKHFSIHFTVGYCFDFKAKLNEGSYRFPGDYWAPFGKSDWSGLRLGLSTSYKF